MQKNNKKGMVASQVFVFIMAVVVFAVILIFGYSAITSFLEKGERANFLIFKNDLEGAVRDIYADYGSVVVYDVNNQFKVPARYQEVCFVDVDRSPPNLNGAFCTQRPILCDAWKTIYDGSDQDEETWDAWEKTDQNIFLTPAGTSPIKVYKIRVMTAGLSNNSVSNAALCVPTQQGILNFKLEGMGSHTRVSEI